jgi:hypothetical protein
MVQLIRCARSTAEECTKADRCRIVLGCSHDWLTDESFCIHLADTVGKAEGMHSCRASRLLELSFMPALNAMTGS